MTAEKGSFVAGLLHTKEFKWLQIGRKQIGHWQKRCYALIGCLLDTTLASKAIAVDWNEGKWTYPPVSHPQGLSGQFAPRSRRHRDILWTGFWTDVPNCWSLPPLSVWLSKGHCPETKWLWKHIIFGNPMELDRGVLTALQSSQREFRKNKTRDNVPDCFKKLTSKKGGTSFPREESLAFVEDSPMSKC